MFSVLLAATLESAWSSGIHRLVEVVLRMEGTPVRARLQRGQEGGPHPPVT